MDELKLFLSNRNRNSWIHTPHLKVYVRKSYRLYPKNFDITLPYDHEVISYIGPNCLDIASVEVNKKYRGQGYFKEFMIVAESINPFKFIMVESVHNPDLRTMLIKNGYVIDNDSACLNFYKMT